MQEVNQEKEAKQVNWEKPEEDTEQNKEETEQEEMVQQEKGQGKEQEIRRKKSREEEGTVVGEAVTCKLLIVNPLAKCSLHHHKPKVTFDLRGV